MDLDLRLQALQRQAVSLVQALTPDQLYTVWLWAGVVLFAALAWVCHRIMRKALGHRKFRGTWFNEEQYETLLKMIDEDCRRGNRVMRHDEMALLRQHRFGGDLGISDRVRGYF